MAKRGDKSTGQIQKLLEERRQIEQWLRKLDMAADETAGAVRDRVRSDYEGRLEKVVEKLQGFTADLQAALDSHQTSHATLKIDEKAASEELAEAELRHAVGEFDESDWREKKSGILERLVKVREGLADEEGEINELEQVLALIEATPAEEEEPAAPTPEQRLSLGAELGLRDLGGGGGGGEEAEPKAAPPKKRQSVDELAFLKSVTEDRRHGPAPSRASGPMRAIPDDGGAPSPTGAGSPQRGSGKAIGADGVQKMDATQVNQSRPSVINQRTLKCGECGAMNLPTEWYCDRCGAELAAL